MQKALQVVFRGIEHSDAVEVNIREKMGKLERYCDSITSCRVVVDKPHNRHSKGELYHITIDLAVPNETIVVDHDQHDNESHGDVYIAIRDAFNAAERQLKSSAGRQRKNLRDETLQPVDPEIDLEPEPAVL